MNGMCEGYPESECTRQACNSILGWQLCDECARMFIKSEDKSQAFKDVIAERVKQDAKWGEQNHDPIVYLAILTEEVGELAQAALHTRFGGHAADGLRTEAIHTAAVALAIVECLDRDKWQWPIVEKA